MEVTSIPRPDPAETLDPAMERNRRRSIDPFSKPSELLQQIGLRGKEVVRILKTRGWEVCDPKALQEHKLYFASGGRAKGELAVQGEDYFVGEGELFAHILEQGGIRFLLPGEGSSTDTKEDSETEFEILDEPPLVQNVNLTANNEVAERQSTSTSTESTQVQGEVSTPQQPKRMRRKKLSTDPKAKPRGRVGRPRKKVCTTNANQAKASSECRVKEEKIPFVAADGWGHLLQFGAYEAALTARGWHAKLLQDVDLHLLRSVAAIARRQLALQVTGGEPTSRSSDNSSPHEGIVQELKVLSAGIKASQNDLSSMIAAIIEQAERVQSTEITEDSARIGIAGFVSTGSGNLVLLRDVERHLLLIVASLRQFLRAKKTSSYTRGGEPSTSRRPDLRALQLNIEKMNAELTELLTIISEQSESLCSKNLSTPMELEVDVDTDSEEWLV